MLGSSFDKVDPEHLQSVDLKIVRQELLNSTVWNGLIVMSSTTMRLEKGDSTEKFETP